MSALTSNLIFKGYRATELSIKAIETDPTIKNFKINPKLGFNIKKHDNGFDVAISVTIENQEDNPVPFELNATIIGKFMVGNNESGNFDRLIPKATEILFPYLRSTVSSLTLAANIPPYILPTINVSKIFLAASLKNRAKNNEESKSKGMEITKVFI